MDHKISSFFLSTLVLVTLVLSACGGDIDDQVQLISGIPDERSTPGPNEYLQFTNHQVSLPSGAYQLVVRPSIGQQAPSEVTVAVADASGHMLPQQLAANNCRNSSKFSFQAIDACFDVEVEFSGGAIIQSPVSGTLYILDKRFNQRFVAPISSVELPQSQLNFHAYGKAYYKRIDPQNTRTTLSDWLSANGFGSDGSNFDSNAVFRDGRDLGYGRNMYMRRNQDGSTALYVENYLVRTANSTGYGNGALSVDAALARNSIYHVGTNAIEFSSYPYPATRNKFAKFYTFDEQGARLDSVDLDGRGSKALPGPCIVCHGGRMEPLVRVSQATTYSVSYVGQHYEFYGDGDVNAKLQALETEAFGFSTLAGHGRSDQEAAIFDINNAVFCTYPGTADQAACRHAVDGVSVQFGEAVASSGSWSADLSRDLLAGWYGGENGIFPTAFSAFDVRYVPPGWRPQPDQELGNPDLSDDLFLNVVSEHCIVCHGIRGVRWQSDIDFSTYKKFLSYRADIQELVFSRGNMPLSAANYQALFGNLVNVQYLQSALGYIDAGQNQLLLPGRVVADAGISRSSTGTTILDAGSSLFAQRFAWNVSKTPNGVATNTVMIRDPAARRTLLIVPADGDYTIGLTAYAADGSSHYSEVVISVDLNMSPAPAELNFHTHIKPILQEARAVVGSDNSPCSSCHNPSNLDYAGIPVWYTDEQPQQGLTLYQSVLQRIDFRYPRWSKLLTKPSGNHHAGGLRPKFDLSSANFLDRQDYDTIVNWILHGAAER